MARIRKRNRFSFKSCPRCKGDMQRSSDEYGEFLSCCQCGYHADIYATVEILREPEPDFQSGNYSLFGMQSHG